MQQLAFLPLLTIASSYFSLVSAVPTNPAPPDDLPQCVVECFTAHISGLEHCQDPGYLSCICENDGPSKFPAIKSCLSETCDDVAIAETISEFLTEDTCAPPEPDTHDPATVTATVTLPCTTDSPNQSGPTVVPPPGTPEVPSAPPPGTTEVPPAPPGTTEVPPPPGTTEVPPPPPGTTEAPPPPPPPVTTPLPGTTGIIPPPGENTTVSTPDVPSSTEPPTTPPDGSSASTLERTVALMGLLGALTVFFAL